LKAVLLAAGRGSRLGPTELPKPLWEIGPRAADDPAQVAIVERQVLLLQALGVNVIVVVGWRQEQVRDRLGSLGVTFVENTHPTISDSGTSHSLQFAANAPAAPFDGKEPCLLLDADLVYERRVLEDVVGSQGPSRLFVSPTSAGDAEEVRVYGDGARPRLIGKGLRPPLTDGLQLIGEATGILRFEPEDHAVVRAGLDWLVGGATGSRAYGFSGIASEHEELAQYLMTLERLAAVRLDADLLFMEADFPEDFERVRAEVYPRILERDGA